MQTCPTCRARFPEDAAFCPACGAATAPVAESPAPPEPGSALVGRVIDSKYRLVDLLGSGGMATVYRAEHVFTKKSLAVKILHPELSRNQEVVQRFEREAQIASALDHPNVVLVTDFGHAPAAEGGFLYLVMEHLAGELLSDRIFRRRGLELGEAVDIVRQVLSAVVRAQELGIVHRDLKPDNVLLVERDGRADFVKILDFGIAKLLQPEMTGQRPLTQAGSPFGTPAYMSPEQCLGQAADGRADLYAVGIMFHEMLAGRRPFDDPDPVKILGLHLSAPPPPLPVGLDPSVHHFVARALSKKREDRWPTAREMLAELETVSLTPSSTGGYEVVTRTTAAAPDAPARAAAAEGAATTAKRPAATARRRAGRRRRGWVRALVLGPVLLLLVGVAVLMALASPEARRGAPALAWHLATASGSPAPARLVSLIRSQQPGRAARLLQALAARGGDGPGHRVVLALDDLEARRETEALGQLEAAAKQRPTLTAEPAVRRALEQLARRPALAARARALLAPARARPK